MINTKDSAAKNEEEDWIKRGKKRLAIFLKNYAFVTVLCMASVSLLARFLVKYIPNHSSLFNIQVPNPLFDLAGLMCGHF